MNRGHRLLTVVACSVIAAALLPQAANASDAAVRDAARPSVSGAPSVPGSFKAAGPVLMLNTAVGIGAAKQPVAPNSSIAVKVTGKSSVPATGVAAVVMNVTASQATANGYLTAYTDGTGKPGGSSLTFTKGATVSNTVVVAVSPSGTVRLHNGSAGTVQLTATVAGYYLGTPAPLPPAPPKPPSPPSPPKPPAGSGSFGDGMHRVGTDVKPGFYRATVPNGELCYWERLKDASGSFESIIENQLIKRYSLINILPTDKFVKTSGCGKWTPVTYTPRWLLGGKIPGDGMFIVGVDIQPGTYHQTTNGCYWARESDADGSLDSIIANDIASGPSYVTIEKTDAIFETSGCSDFTRTG